MLLDRGLLARGRRATARPAPIEELDSPGDAAGADRRSPRRPRRRRSAACSRTPPCSARPSRTRLLRRSPDCPETSSSRCSPRWFARRSWASRQIRAHPSEGSTDSSRRSSGAWPTRRSRARSAKTRHLAAAAQLEESVGEDEQEIVEVVAAHYVAAYEAQPDADDADSIRRAPASFSPARASGQGHLPRSERRGSTSSRRPSFRTSRSRRRVFSSGRGQWQTDSAEFDAARERSSPHSSFWSKLTSATPRPACWAGSPKSKCSTGRSEQARERLERAFAAVAADEPDADVADLASRLAQSYAFSGAHDPPSSRSSSRSRSPRPSASRRR